MCISDPNYPFSNNTKPKTPKTKHRKHALHRKSATFSEKVSETGQSIWNFTKPILVKTFKKTSRCVRAKTMKYLPNDRDTTLTIGSFNIANFGESKFKKESILKVIIEIIHEYDLLVVQEIRSEDFDVVDNVLDRLNQYCAEIGSFKYYSARKSKFVGSEHRLEQYGYFYNERKLDLISFGKFDEHQWWSTNSKKLFMYEPCIASFMYNHNKFTVVGVHIQKDSVVQELNNLVDVYDRLGMHEAGSVVFMGDFNAEGSYLRRKDVDDVKIFKDKRFTCLIGDDVDTTVVQNRNAYDRIFVAGEFFSGLSEGDGRVFRFDEDFGMSLKAAFKVSDHYPVGFKL